MRAVIQLMALAAAFLAFQALTQDDVPFIWRMILFLIPSAFLGGLTLLLESRRRRWLTAYRDARAQELPDALLGRLQPEEPLFLFLRPFASTGRLTIENPAVARANAAMPGAYEPKVLEAESVLRDALDRFGTLVALGSPGEHYGAGRVATQEAEWQDRFLLLAERAHLIFLLPSSAAGTLWEIQQLRDRAWLPRTVIVMPPAIGHGGFAVAEEWERARTKLAELGLTLPPHQEKGALFSLGGSVQPAGVTDWMRRKQRRLQDGLQRLAREMNVPIETYATAGTRIDAPVPRSFFWILAFWLMTFDAHRRWPSSGDEFSGIGGTESLVVGWAASAIALGLLMFLLLESTYGRLGGKAIRLLVCTAILATSPYSFLPPFDLFDVGPYWLRVSTVIRAGSIGILLAAVLRELVPVWFRWAHVALLTIGAFSAARLFEIVARSGPELALPFALPTSTEPLAGFLFGLGVVRATKWNPSKPQSVVTRPLGVEGFAIGWAVAGYVVPTLLTPNEWGDRNRPLFWILLALAGGFAQAYGWSRQGRPFAWPRGLLLAIGWGAIALVMVLVTGTIALETLREALNGLLFGAGGGMLAAAIGRAGGRFPAKPTRHAAVLAAGFAMIGIAYLYLWNYDLRYVFFSSAPPLPLFLAVLLATAAYLDVRDVPDPTQKPAKPPIPVETHLDRRASESYGS